jgi:hypothetical protein
MLRWARGSVVFEAECYKTEGLGFETRWGNYILSSYVILPAAIDPHAYSACKGNNYQTHKKMFVYGRARPKREADRLTAICEPIV